MGKIRKTKQKPPLIGVSEEEPHGRFPNLCKSFLHRINSFGGIAILVCTLIGLGYKAGSYYESVKKERELSESTNKHLLELLDIREKYNKELMELNNQINILNIRYEKECSKNKK